MKVSTKVQYGLIALADIAINSVNKTLVSSSDISVRQNISQKYLEQILTYLKQAGFIKAHKGSGGGYTLSRSAETIKMSEVLNALDNSILTGTFQPESNCENRLHDSVNAFFWEKINGCLMEFAHSMTLKDFITQCFECRGNDWDMYVI